MFDLVVERESLRGIVIWICSSLGVGGISSLENWLENVGG